MVSRRSALLLGISSTLAACTSPPPPAAAAASQPRQSADRWFTTTDGVRLHYTDTGDGTAMVLIPGWTMPASIFAPQIASFSRGHRVVAFDPRSQGDSEIAPAGHTADRRGRDIAELLDRLGPHPVVLVAWSLGVLDTLAAIREIGDARIAGLVLVDNSVGEDPAPVSTGMGSRPRRQRPVPREVAVARFVRGMFRRPQSPEYLAALTRAALRTPATAGESAAR